MPQDLWDDRDAHLKDFPDHLLFDIARNDSAQRPYRRHAVEILVVRKSPRVKHPDLADLVAELEIELDGIQFEYPAPSGPGPLVASVTTETMMQDDAEGFETREELIEAETRITEAIEKESECPTILPSPMSPGTEKLPSTPTAASGETRTPRSTKKASGKPTS